MHTGHNASLTGKGKRSIDGTLAQYSCLQAKIANLRGCLKSIGSPLAPWERGELQLKVPLSEGDLGGSEVFCYLS